MSMEGVGTNKTPTNYNKKLRKSQRQYLAAISCKKAPLYPRASASSSTAVPPSIDASDSRCVAVALNRAFQDSLVLFELCLAGHYAPLSFITSFRLLASRSKQYLGSLTQ